MNERKPIPASTPVWAALKVQETLTRAKALAASEWRRRADELQFRSAGRQL